MKLLKKHGFTLVEMIVVIAIIAILLAIVVPLMSTASGFETEVRENARAFYSNVQEAITDEKLAGTLTDADGKVLVVATVDPDSGTSTANVTVHVLKNFTVPPADLSGVPEIDKDSTDPLAEFSSTLQKLLSTNEDKGTYLALVDNKQRVVSAYFSFGEYADLVAGTHEFTSDYHVNDMDAYTGAYPFELFQKGKVLLS